MERKFSKNTQYDCLINYIPEPIRKSIGCLKDIIVGLFKTNTSKQIVYGRGNKLSKPKTQNIRNPFIPEDKIVRDIRTLFEQEEDYLNLKE